MTDRDTRNRRKEKHDEKIKTINPLVAFPPKPFPQFTASSSADAKQKQQTLVAMHRAPVSSAKGGGGEYEKKESLRKCCA